MELWQQSEFTEEKLCLISMINVFNKACVYVFPIFENNFFRRNIWIRNCGTHIFSNILAVFDIYALYRFDFFFRHWCNIVTPIERVTRSLGCALGHGWKARLASTGRDILVNLFPRWCHATGILKTLRCPFCRIKYHIIK